MLQTQSLSLASLCIIMEYSSSSTIVLLISRLILFSICIKGQNTKIFVIENQQKICPHDERMRVVCMVALWYENNYWNKFSADNLDPFYCTHVVATYAQVTLSTVGNDQTWIFHFQEALTDIVEKEKRERLLKNLFKLKAVNPSTRYLISIGGWADWNVDKYNTIATNKLLQETFLNQVSQFLHEFDADGIDFFWDFPGREPGNQRWRNVDNLRKITQALCSRMRKEGLLCMITLKSLELLGQRGHENVRQIVHHADLVNIWTIDLHTGGMLDHTSMLRLSQSVPSFPMPTVNINSVVEYYQDAIGNESRNNKMIRKLSIVIPMKSKVFGLSLPSSSGSMGPPSIGSMDVYQQLGNVVLDRYNYPFYNVCALTQNLYDNGDSLTIHEYFSHDQDWGGFPIAYNLNFKPNGGIAIPTITKNYAKKEVKYARSAKLGGVTIFHITADDVHGWCYNESYPILSAISEEARRC